MGIPYNPLEVPESTDFDHAESNSSARLSDALGAGALSVAVIGPIESQRRAVVAAISTVHACTAQEISSYPKLDDLPRLLQASFDVVIIELDTNPEHALELVENICSGNNITVMVYSNQVRPDLLMRCMQAGAREFLTEPVTAVGIAEAMVRAAVRRPAKHPASGSVGKTLVFVGAKGGSGVTTIASNFAVALAQDSGKKVALIDLNLPFGNAALDLGLKAQYSTATALMDTQRLDSNYLSTLLVKHPSGLSVLSAPDRYVPVHATEDAIEKLVQIARQSADFVIVDAGSRFDSASNPLFDDSTVYLVLQVGVAELRNANRLISEIFRPKNIRFQIVVNRYAARALSLDEDSISRALTTPVSWKVPGDFAVARSAQDTATPLVYADNSISRVIRQMAQAVYAPAELPEKKKKKFRLLL